MLEKGYKCFIRENVITEMVKIWMMLNVGTMTKKEKLDISIHNLNAFVSIENSKTFNILLITVQLLYIYLTILINFVLSEAVFIIWISNVLYVVKICGKSLWNILHQLMLERRPTFNMCSKFINKLNYITIRAICLLQQVQILLPPHKLSGIKYFPRYFGLLEEKSDYDLLGCDTA